MNIRKIAPAFAPGLLLLASCAPLEFEDPPTQSEDLACVGPTWQRRVEALYDQADGSIHELITCGGMQVQASGSLLPNVLLAHEALLEPAARLALEAMRAPAPPFVQDADGVWGLPAGDTAASSLFELRFFEEGAEVPIQADVFRLDSYLAGVRGESEAHFEEMYRQPWQRFRFTLRWEGPGPLAHVLFPEGEPEVRELVLHLSMEDLMGLLEPEWRGARAPDLGPFEHLRTLEVESRMDYLDARFEASVRYTVRGARDKAVDQGASGDVAYDLERVEAEGGGARVIGTPIGLRYVGGIGKLAGRIDFEVTAPESRALVVADFGDGAAGPTPRWSCPAD